MALSTGILSLGTRADATTWEHGCQGLGFTIVAPIKKGSPSLKDLKAFFAGSPDWLFFGGHFGGLTLFNESASVSIEFAAKQVILAVGDARATLRKTNGTFAAHRNCKVVLWGGCNVCESEDTIRTLRQLFGNHVLLGFKGRTRWFAVNAILGGGEVAAGRFFDLVKSDPGSPETVRQAWLQAAISAAAVGEDGGAREKRARAVDPDGQEWGIIRNKKTKALEIARTRRVT